MATISITTNGKTTWDTTKKPTTNVDWCISLGDNQQSTNGSKGFWGFTVVEGELVFAMIMMATWECPIVTDANFDRWTTRGSTVRHDNPTQRIRKNDQSKMERDMVITNRNVKECWRKQ